ncbi:MAG: DUF507 family protein [Thermodesulfobacteriota bacterium]|jgi:hypothetical protein
MRHLETLCRHAADAVVETLLKKDLLRLRADKKEVSERVAAALLDNFRQEEALEKEAERLADEHMRTGQGLDRHRVVQLIKKRLAEERGFVL